MTETISQKLSTISENVPKVYEAGVEAGKKAEYDAWWDVVLTGGTRTDFSYAFSRWNLEYIRPIRKLAPYNATHMCSRTPKLKRFESEYFDFSKCQYAQYIFMSSAVEEVDGISSDDYTGAFQSASKLRSIDKLKCHANTIFKSTFHYCNNLVSLTIDGTIGQNGFNVQWSTKLSHDSLMSVLNALQDKTSDTSGTEWVVTLGAENIAKLTEEEKKKFYEKGWTLG